jgi:hypothetical protein
MKLLWTDIIQTQLKKLILKKFQLLERILKINENKY